MRREATLAATRKESPEMKTYPERSKAILSKPEHRRRRRELKSRLSTLGVVLMLSALIFASLGATPIHAASSGVYVVQRDDTMLTIAARHSVSVSQLAGANGLKWNSWVYTGQQLSIPAPLPSTARRTHTVRWGETLASIARHYGVSTKSLAADNHILPPGWVYAGEVLTIPAPTLGAMDEYAEWTSYSDQRFGYALRYPLGAKVMGTDLNTSVQFIGPSADGEYWPWFFVDHYNSDFYHPPAATDVVRWVIDSGVPYDAIGPVTEMAGLPTLHLIYEPSPQAYGADHFYFIRGDQLFHIRILHTNGHQDWELHEKFLRSFSFS